MRHLVDFLRREPGFPALAVYVTFYRTEQWQCQLRWRWDAFMLCRISQKRPECNERSLILAAKGQYLLSWFVCMHNQPLSILDVNGQHLSAELRSLSYSSPENEDSITMYFESGTSIYSFFFSSLVVRLFPPCKTVTNFNAI